MVWRVCLVAVVTQINYLTKYPSASNIKFPPQPGYGLKRGIVALLKKL